MDIGMSIGMDWAHWLAFVGVALFVTFTPGPAVLLAISNALAHGPRRAMVSSVGNAIGLLFVSAAASAGLGVLLQTSATAFLVLKLAGACYLVYLGVRQFRSGAGALGVQEPGEGPGEAAGPRVSSWRLFGNGLTVALTNPKAILFFTALFPQFMGHGGGQGQFVVLTLTFAACAVTAHGVYVLLARSLRRHLSNPRRVRWLNRLFGGSFVLLGVGLLGLRSRAP